MVFTQSGVRFDQERAQLVTPSTAAYFTRTEFMYTQVHCDAGTWEKILSDVPIDKPWGEEFKKELLRWIDALHCSDGLCLYRLTTAVSIIASATKEMAQKPHHYLLAYDFGEVIQEYVPEWLDRATPNSYSESLRAILREEYLAMVRR